MEGWRGGGKGVVGWDMSASSCQAATGLSHLEKPVNGQSVLASSGDFGGEIWKGDLGRSRQEIWEQLGKALEIWRDLGKMWGGVLEERSGGWEGEGRGNWEIWRGLGSHQAGQERGGEAGGRVGEGSYLAKTGRGREGLLASGAGAAATDVRASCRCRAGRGKQSRAPGDCQTLIHVHTRKADVVVPNRVVVEALLGSYASCSKLSCSTCSSTTCIMA